MLQVLDQGGKGRLVKTCNIAYLLALEGKGGAYVYLGSGSQTAGAIFEIARFERGVDNGGLHSYVASGDVGEPHHVDVRANSDRAGLSTLQPKAGRPVLFPGDRGGAEYPDNTDMVHPCGGIHRAVAE